jgi:hypothetical protein
MKLLSKSWCFTGAFGVIGAIVPIALEMSANYFQTLEREATNHPHDYFDHISLVLWPSSIFELGQTGPGSGYGLFTILLIANALLYAFIGRFIWLGITKDKGFLAVPVLTIAIMCWWGLLFLK